MSLFFRPYSTRAFRTSDWGCVWPPELIEVWSSNNKCKCNHNQS